MRGLRWAAVGMIAVGAGLALNAAAQSASAPAGHTVYPEWLRKPSGEELSNVYPANTGGRPGEAQIRCVVTVRGTLDKCEVIKESPPGLGFGSAALALAPLFMMKPKTVDGQPVGGAMVIVPIRFAGGGPQPDITATIRVARSLPWEATPTSAEVASAFPKQAVGKSAFGHVVLRCHVTGERRLNDCDLISEQPSGLGFAGAARGLTKLFRVSPDSEALKEIKDLYVEAPFDFRDPGKPAAPLEIFDPEWVRAPDPDAAGSIFPPEAAKAGFKTGLGLVACQVEHNGALSHCSVEREDPPGVGFGPTALAMANMMVMNPWTKQGAPVDDAKIQLPIRLNYGGEQPGPASAGPAPGAADPAAKIAIASTVYASHDGAGAKSMLKAIVEAPGFAALPAVQRHDAQALYGRVLLDDGDYPEALVQLKAATAADTATGEDWVARVRAELWTRDDAGALVSLTTIARRWPSAVSQVDDLTVFDLAGRTRPIEALSKARLELLDALSHAHWRPRDTFRVADSLWLDLTAALLEQGQLQQAREAAENIISPAGVARIKIDRRYDPIVAADPDRYDVAKTAARRLATVRQAAAAAPERLANVNGLALALLNQGQSAEALSIVDRAIKSAHPVDGSKPPFVDIGQLNWTYNIGAYALAALGRGEEAVARMKAGAELPENGGGNISQLFNLAEFYVDVGQPATALETLKPIDPGVASAYGRMELWGVRARAYADLHDKAGLSQSLAYLKAHVADAPADVVEVLAEVQDRDAAAVAIKALADPLQRARVLGVLQDYLPGDPELARSHPSIVALRQRPDVKAAVEEVGRIEAIPLVSLVY